MKKESNKGLVLSNNKSEKSSYLNIEKKLNPSSTYAEFIIFYLPYFI